MIIYSCSTFSSCIVNTSIFFKTWLTVERNQREISYNFFFSFWYRFIELEKLKGFFSSASVI